MKATAEALVRWFELHQRDLPWRRSYDPYHIWVSEAMLQQTQVETVIPYFERFIQRYPTLHSLARAADEDVMKLWSGLGYYTRARNLLAAMRLVEGELGGVIPQDPGVLGNLPGVGPYMTGAILSIAFNQPAPIVDGNVRRVLSRIHGWLEDDPKRLWLAAAELVREGPPRLVNQAVMELGATVCSFRAPRCLICPVQQHCAAFRMGLQSSIPPVRRRTPAIHVDLFAIVHTRGQRAWMKPNNGLWEFPMLPELPEGRFVEHGECRHAVTHHRLRVRVVSGKCRVEGGRWVVVEDAAVSSLTRKIWTTFRGAHA